MLVLKIFTNDKSLSLKFINIINKIIFHGIKVNRLIIFSSGIETHLNYRKPSKHL